MQNKNRRVRSRRIYLVECWHAALGELKFCPSTDYSYPLWRRRSGGLVFEHAQCVGQRRHAVPAQLHVVAEAAADRMRVRIVETRDDRAALRVNYCGRRASLAQNLLV